MHTSQNLITRPRFNVSQQTEGKVLMTSWYFYSQQAVLSWSRKDLRSKPLLLVKNNQKHSLSDALPPTTFHNLRSSCSYLPFGCFCCDYLDVLYSGCNVLVERLWLNLPLIWFCLVTLWPIPSALDRFIIVVVCASIHLRRSLSSVLLFYMLDINILQYHIESV